jgi:hypothetical protein
MSEPPNTPTYRKNATAWRAYNRRRYELERAAAGDDPIPFVCECTSGACFAAMELTPRQFRAAHRGATWTAVLPEHVLLDDGSRVVVRHETHWVAKLVSIA